MLNLNCTGNAKSLAREQVTLKVTKMNAQTIASTTEKKAKIFANILKWNCCLLSITEQFISRHALLFLLTSLLSFLLKSFLNRWKEHSISSTWCYWYADQSFSCQPLINCWSTVSWKILRGAVLYNDQDKNIVN